MSSRRAIVVQFTPEELLKFYTVGGDAIWRVKCKGLPSDYRVVDIKFNPVKKIVEVCLETEEPDRFFAVPLLSSPPNSDIFSEVEFVGTCNSHSRSQCPTVSYGTLGES